MSAYFLLFLSTWFAARIKHNNKLRYIVFLVPTILIVGFRFEMGFDWPVYKNQFIDLSSVNFYDFFSQFSAITFKYPHEPLFLVISYFASQILPSYEYFQASIYVLFVYSIFKLGNAIGVKNIIACFIPIHLYLLFTLEFSTIRQSIAISLFNIGLAYSLQNNKNRYIWFGVASIFTQSSTLLYIFTKKLSISTTKLAKLTTFLGITLVIFLSSGGLKLLPISIFPEFIVLKINYYLYDYNFGYSFIELGIFILNILVIVFVLLNAGKNMEKKTYFISRFVVFLCIVAILVIWVTVMRNRIMYEIIILVSLMIYGSKFPYQKFLRYSFLTIGSLLLLISFIQKSSFVYIPYQNYIWYQINGYESDGEKRLDRLNQLIYQNQNQK